MKDWQRLSFRRLLEAIALCAAMILVRGLVNVSFGEEFAGRLVSQSGEMAIFVWCSWFLVLQLGCLVHFVDQMVPIASTMIESFPY